MKAYAIALLILSLLIAGPSVSDEKPPAPSGNLHMACLQGDLGVVEGHIAAGSDLDAADAYGSTPLTIAITFGRTEIARALIEGGADLEWPDKNGSSPLIVAAFFSRTEIVQTLLEHGASKFVRNDSGSTAYDVVQAPFDIDRPTYDQLAGALSPLGLKLDYERIAAARPGIAGMLKLTDDDLLEINYAPEPDNGWEVSTPGEQGLDPELISEFYQDASHLNTIYSVLVIKNGKLISEAYFNLGTPEQKALLQSASKSYTSALVGIAIELEYLRRVETKVLDFFPEIADDISDYRKEIITIEQMLQMRAGYPWEETSPMLWEGLWAGEFVPLLEEFPLTRDPGTEFQYSNLTSNWLGLIVARAYKKDLKVFAEKYLFGPLGVEIGEWQKDVDDNYIGCGGMHFTARDMARFGQLYLNRGVWEGRKIIPAEWVEASLTEYSTNVSTSGVVNGRRGRYLYDIGYGYQWWSGKAGRTSYWQAAGHGGQHIVLIPSLEMVIVTTADPFIGKNRHFEAGKYEAGIVNVLGKFIASLPGE